MQNEFNKFAQDAGHIVRDKLTEMFSSVIKIVIVTITTITLTIIASFGILAYLIIDSNNNKNTTTTKIIKKTVYVDKTKEYNKKDYFIIPKNKMILIKTKKIKNKLLKYYRYENNDTYFYITYYKK